MSSRSRHPTGRSNRRQYLASHRPPSALSSHASSITTATSLPSIRPEKITSQSDAASSVSYRTEDDERYAHFMKDLTLKGNSGYRSRSDLLEARRVSAFGHHQVLFCCCYCPHVSPVKLPASLFLSLWSSRACCLPQQERLQFNKRYDLDGDGEVDAFEVRLANLVDKDKNGDISSEERVKLRNLIASGALDHLNITENRRGDGAKQALTWVGSTEYQRQQQTQSMRQTQRLEEYDEFLHLNAQEVPEDSTGVLRRIGSKLNTVSPPGPTWIYSLK